jgi:hypothetical protein
MATTTAAAQLRTAVKAGGEEMANVDLFMTVAPQRTR